MSHAQAGAWWSDVEHLREAAERRIAERERAQREGRAPLLTPLGTATERMADPAAHPARFRRASVPSSISPAAAARARAAAAATSTALAHELAPVEETWGDLDHASPAPELEPTPEP